MNRGDVLWANRGGFDHVGIYIGEGLVIHFSGEPLNSSTPRIVATTMEGFIQSSYEYGVMEFEFSRPPDEVIQTAMAFLGADIKYDVTGLQGWNCEHFAYYCKTGVPLSPQIGEIVEKGIEAVLDVDSRDVFIEELIDRAADQLTYRLIKAIDEIEW